MPNTSGKWFRQGRGEGAAAAVRASMPLRMKTSPMGGGGTTMLRESALALDHDAAPLGALRQSYRETANTASMKACGWSMVGRVGRRRGITTFLRAGEFLAAM